MEKERKKSFDALPPCRPALAKRAKPLFPSDFPICIYSMAPRRSLSPRVYLLCNRCAIRTDDAAISAPLARSGDSNSRPKLRARLARPFPRLPRFAWGREKERRPLPCLSLPCLSLPSLSLSALHLHQLLTGCRARRAGQCCYHGDEEEGSRHFWGECYQDSSMTGGRSGDGDENEIVRASQKPKRKTLFSPPPPSFSGPTAVTLTTCFRLLPDPPRRFLSSPFSEAFPPLEVAACLPSPHFSPGRDHEKINFSFSLHQERALPPRGRQWRLFGTRRTRCSNRSRAHAREKERDEERDQQAERKREGFGGG